MGVSGEDSGLFPTRFWRVHARNRPAASFSPASECARSMAWFVRIAWNGEEAKPMHTKQRFPNAMFHVSLRPDSATLAILLTLFFLLFLLLFLILTPQPAQAQTYKVIYNFTGGDDGSNPGGRLAMDANGNLYGTAAMPRHTIAPVPESTRLTTSMPIRTYLEPLLQRRFRKPSLKPMPRMSRSKTTP